MRGPGRSRAGNDVERLGKPCPPELADYYMAKAFGFRILPPGLVPGSTEDQPAAIFAYYSNLLAEEASKTERLQYIQQMKQQARGGRR
jgi:hypothetical protein